MRVDLGGGYVAVPQQLLHRADVITCLDQMRCEAMPQRKPTGEVREHRAEPATRGGQDPDGAMPNLTVTKIPDPVHYTVS
jgi:hypothetical protein